MKPADCLRPGQMRAWDRPREVTTVLGSCVSACLWDTERGLAEANHCVLPDAPSAPAEAGRLFRANAAAAAVRVL